MRGLERDISFDEFIVMGLLSFPSQRDPMGLERRGNCLGAGPDPALEDGTSLTKNKCRLTDGLHLFCTPGGT